MSLRGSDVHYNYKRPSRGIKYNKKVKTRGNIPHPPVVHSELPERDPSNLNPDQDNEKRLTFSSFQNEVLRWCENASPSALSPLRGALKIGLLEN